MSNTKNNIDILKELDIKNEIERLQNESDFKENNIEGKAIDFEEDQINQLKKLDIKKEIEKLQNQADKEILSINTKQKVEKEELILKQRINNRKKKSKKIYLLSSIIFFSKYLITSSLIFAVLLITTNYSAYINIAKSYIYSWQMKESSQRLVSSVEAADIKEKYSKKVVKKIDKEKIIWKTQIDSKLSLNTLKKNEDKKDINLSIEITPYSNRVIIPKIWKNIPLIDIANKNIDWQNELNDIFMKDLENWIIRYPWSAKPWNLWTSFIFWHSSNYPWIKWDYNDVFALLDNVSYDDEIIVYYWQKKYTYKVKEKKVINPWDTSVLWNKKDKSKISLMTCWPVWTTLHRLIVTWELVEK